MNLKEIREILELLKGSDVSEFELGRGDMVLKLRRGPVNVPVAMPLAPNVEHQYNYGWGIPSSRLTPISRFIPEGQVVRP